MNEWISTKDELPPDLAKVVARNPHAESVSWIQGKTELGKPCWMHKDEWNHADDYVTDWRWMTGDEIEKLF